MFMIAMMLIAAEPSDESIALGREMANVGTLATILPMMEKAETDALVAEHPELSAAEQSRLRDVAHATYFAGREKALAADARAYASHLSIADLRALVAFSRTDAARHLRAAMPTIATATMQDLGAINFKGEARDAFCKETGKLCPAK
ncbi:MAG: DUF2059 domain-containing protein [Sphingomicrobium sp.]